MQTKRAGGEGMEGNNIWHTLDKIKKQNVGEKKQNELQAAQKGAAEKNRSAASNVIRHRRKIPTNGSQNAGGSRASWQCPAPSLLLCPSGCCCCQAVATSGRCQRKWKLCQMRHAKEKEN